MVTWRWSGSEGDAGDELPEQHVVVAFAREHPKFIYFLLTTAAVATGYALSDISDEGTLRRAHCGARRRSNGCRMLSFRIGCIRLISMLSGLHEVSTDFGAPEPYGTYISGGRAELAAATDAAGSAAMWQLRCLFGGVRSYVIGIVADVVSRGRCRGIPCRVAGARSHKTGVRIR